MEDELNKNGISAFEWRSFIKLSPDFDSQKKLKMITTVLDDMANDPVGREILERAQKNYPNITIRCNEEAQIVNAARGKYSALPEDNIFKNQFNPVTAILNVDFNELKENSSIGANEKGGKVHITSLNKAISHELSHAADENLKKITEHYTQQQHLVIREEKLLKSLASDKINDSEKAKLTEQLKDINSQLDAEVRDLKTPKEKSEALLAAEFKSSYATEKFADELSDRYTAKFNEPSRPASQLTDIEFNRKGTILVLSGDDDYQKKKGLQKNISSFEINKNINDIFDFKEFDNIPKEDQNFIADAYKVCEQAEKYEMALKQSDLKLNIGIAGKESDLNNKSPSANALNAGHKKSPAPDLINH